MRWWWRGSARATTASGSIASAGTGSRLAMRTPGRDAMRRLLPAVLAVAVVAAVAGACGNSPDTTLQPDPPAVTYAPLQHPFRGARLFVDDQTAGARWQREHRATWLDPITTRPQARWLNGPQDLTKLPTLAARARRQRALLVLVAYYLPNRGCSSSSDQGAPTSRHYRRWIDRLIDHLGSTRAAIVVEPDAVAADCFDTRRAILLSYSVKRLANAGQHVYLDAGHARWRSTGEMAQRLLRAGVQYAQGFSVNVANRQTTRQSYRWGRELSDSSAGASSSSTPPATASALPRMTRTGTTSGATHDARHWARPPRPGRGCLGWPRCSGSSFPANRTASAEERRPTCSRRGRRAG